ncbi:MAG: AAA family ATPase [Deltaproteobacteria bacterium]|jgi:hypothetical protein|nr:AAA family ATPase [Deltaproteobacteria bacterium]
MKDLLVGAQTFQKLIEGNYVYADKTKFIYDLARTQGAYFLSRPRRFGKTLLLSTFEALFSSPLESEGPETGLFSGLWLEKKIKELNAKGKKTLFDFNQTYPIIRLDMSGDTSTVDGFRESILKKLEVINRSEGLGLKITLPGADLSTIIQRMSEKYEKEVVVLVDEYDAAVSDNISNIDIAMNNRDTLKDFYSGFKNTDKYLRFVFVTGVTRYALMGLSSGLNHLVDLTFKSEYAGICGFTYRELDSCFKKHMKVALKKMKKSGDLRDTADLDFLRKQILRWYDGYSWDGKTRVLNPHSILNLFDNYIFSRYWVNTYPSKSFLSVLMDLMNKDPFNLIREELDKSTITELGVAEVGTLKPIPTLFQTGYLTVDTRLTSDTTEPNYLLKIPNWEIKSVNFDLFSDRLFELLKFDKQQQDDNFQKAINDMDELELTRIFNSLFSGLPAIHHVDNESCYFKILYGYCNQIKRLILPEIPESIGTPDLIVVFPNSLYAVIELKYNVGKIGDIRADTSTNAKEAVEEKSERIPADNLLLRKLANNALIAIRDKKYWAPFEKKAKKLVKIGIGVSYRGQCLALVGEPKDFS